MENCGMDQPTNVSWDELPFAQEGPEPDIDGAVNKTLRKMRKISAKYSKTPRLLKILKPAKGWTSWDPSGKKKKKQKSFFFKFRCQKIGV